jgi:hypothetical protein
MPVDVAKPGAVKAIASGAFHALALLADGRTLRTWGTPDAAQQGLLNIPEIVGNKTILAVAAVGDCSVVSVKESPGIIQWGAGCLKNNYHYRPPPAFTGISSPFVRIVGSGLSMFDKGGNGPAATFAGQRADGRWQVWGTFADAWQDSRATARAATNNNAAVGNILAFGNG